MNHHLRLSPKHIGKLLCMSLCLALCLSFVGSANRSVHAQTGAVKFTDAISSKPDSASGATFFTTTKTVYYAAGQVLLAGDMGGTQVTSVDDALSFDITHRDGSTQHFTHVYTASSPATLPPTDISSLFAPGKNVVAMRLFDSGPGGGSGNSAIWLSGITDAPNATVNARAYGALVTSSLLFLSINVGPLNDVQISGTGGNQQATLALVNVPLVLSTGTLIDSASGSLTPAPQANASSSIEHLAVLGLQVDLASSDAQADYNNGTPTVSGSTTLTATQLNGIVLPVDPHPAPNTTISLPGLGNAILNEQIVTQQNGTTSIAVNAIHLHVSVGALAELDIILSHSEAGITLS